MESSVVRVIVPIIIVFIICMQLFFFLSNRKKMKEYRDIFWHQGDVSKVWDVTFDAETNYVNGISVGAKQNNHIIRSIIKSINKYLRNMAGSVIDFSLLKDTVDRHCQTVEDEIQTQMPVPLYCGLAGTMAGVIIGLWSLLENGGIQMLMNSSNNMSPEDIARAVNSIDDLLAGVAWAMVASIFGIIFTTCNSVHFKSCKQKEEEGKNDFLTWMQSNLLPELPTDTSQAMNKLVANLNKFNDTFAQNNEALGLTMSKINESYQTSAQILETVNQMDVRKMATANVRVLKSLQDCMPMLEYFTNYLTTINDYTKILKDFTERFNSECERYEVLEQIRDAFECFVNNHKAIIEEGVVRSGDTLSKALSKLNETAAKNVSELEDTLTMQTDKFKSVNSDISEAFEKQLETLPDIMTKLREVSEIPAQLLALTKKIEKSNDKLVEDITSSNERLAKEMGQSMKNIKVEVVGVGQEKSMPKWMKITAVVVVSLLTLSSLATTTVLWIGDKSEQAADANAEEVDAQGNSVDLMEQENSSVPVGKPEVPYNNVDNGVHHGKINRDLSEKHSRQATKTE